jgi:rRNA maturation protein Nop10
MARKRKNKTRARVAGGNLSVPHVVFDPQDKLGGFRIETLTRRINRRDKYAAFAEMV